MDCKISNKIKKLIIFSIISLLLTKSNESIEIEGNLSFDDKIVGKLIKSTPHSSDSDEESKSLHLDLLAIKSFYQNNGFLDVTVNHKIKENKFYYIINEKVQYYNGDMTISGNKLFKDKDVENQFFRDSKIPFNPNLYRESILKLKNQYLEHGKIAVRINDKLIKEGNKINIDIKIEEGDTYFINDIKIIGLNQIDEEYILRESQLLFDRGDIFSNSLISSFQNRLFESDLFSSVYIDTEIAEKNKVNIKVLINEFENMNESYIDLGFGKDIGVNSDLKNYFLCASKNKIRNIFDSGNNLNFNFELNIAFNNLIENSAIIPDFKLDASLNSSWFFSSPINTEFQFQIDQIYDQSNEQLLIYSLDLMLSKIYKKYTWIHKFTLKRADSSPNNANYFSYKITLDKTNIDDFIFPKSGSVKQFHYSYNANIDDFKENYNKIDFNLINYFSITDKSVYANRFYFGVIFNPSDANILPDDYFQLGGANSLRGWSDYSDYMDWLDINYDLGNIANDYSEDCFLMNHEIRYRYNSKISTQIFIDAGKLFINENQGKLDWNYGIGFSYFTALGPIRIDFAKIGSNINKNKSYISLAFLYAF